MFVFIEIYFFSFVFPVEMYFSHIFLPCDVSGSGGWLLNVCTVKFSQNFIFKEYIATIIELGIIKI